MKFMLLGKCCARYIYFCEKVVWIEGVALHFTHSAWFIGHASRVINEQLNGLLSASRQSSYIALHFIAVSWTFPSVFPSKNWNLCTFYSISFVNKDVYFIEQHNKKKSFAEYQTKILFIFFLFCQYFTWGFAKRNFFRKKWNRVKEPN
jgi:hypothetical protein